MAYCSHMPSTGRSENLATIRYQGMAMISTVCIQKMWSERRPTASRKRTMRPWKWLSRMNSRMNKRPAAPSRKMLRGPSDHSASEMPDIGSMSTMTKAEGEAFGKLGNDVFLMIESFPIPVIAAVNGFALGGGNELAMSCDIRICSDNAVFGQPEVGLGITPGFGGTQRLARLVGMGMAKQLVYSALNIKADEAYRIGLVNAVYPQAELMENVLKLAGKIAKNAPIAVRNCKKAINDGISLPIEKAVEVEEKLFGACFETHDQQEGMACFLSREKPKPKAVFTNN